MTEQPSGWNYSQALEEIEAEYTAHRVRPNGNPLGVGGHGANGHDKQSVPQIVNGASITPRPVSWLCPGWLAAGKFHVLAGSPGTGKTTMAVAFAAAVTAGGHWPDGSRAPIGDVLMWSGEDDPADSLVPRLLASGGDRKRFHVVDGMIEAGKRRSFDPSCDIPALLDASRALSDLRMLIIDPVVSAVAGDSHKNAETRRGLQPVVDFAAQNGCVVLGITHFTKSTTGREPIDRVTGSLAFGALPRLVMATAKPAEPGGKRRLVRAKSNIGPDGGGYEYDLIQELLADFDFSAQRIAWGAALEGSARELLNDVEQAGDTAPRSSPRRDIAVEFLRDLLADGRISVKRIEAESKAAGMSWATVRRAATALGVVAARIGGLGDSGEWQWRLPDGEEIHS
jgi:putative DNA primase/helicase